MGGEGEGGWDETIFEAVDEIFEIILILSDGDFNGLLLFLIGVNNFFKHAKEIRVTSFFR